MSDVYERTNTPGVYKEQRYKKGIGLNLIINIYWRKTYCKKRGFKKIKDAIDFQNRFSTESGFFKFDTFLCIL